MATLTDAAVLASFVLVNASLFWLAARGRARSRGARRVADIALSGAAGALCAWLALHTGWIGLLAILVILLAGGLVSTDGRRAVRRLVGRVALRVH